MGMFMANGELMGFWGLNYYFFGNCLYIFCFVKIYRLNLFHIFVVNGMLIIISKFLFM